MNIFIFISFLVSSSQLLCQTYPFVLPTLTYDYGALEPHIDTQTMKIHHQKHHKKYVDELNKALKGYVDLQKMELTDLVKTWKNAPLKIRKLVRINAGGHLNHTLLWQWLTPQKTTLSGKLLDDISSTFGSIEAFKQSMKDAVIQLVGSGWVWLTVNADGKLAIATTRNQDNPISKKLYPIFGIDVWEHAYYLKYQNRRIDYVNALWNVIDWDEVAEHYRAVLSRLNRKGSGVIVIPGITGDLAKRKLIPALYNLLQKEMRFFIVGTAREAQDRIKILESARPFITDCTQEGFEHLKNSFHFHVLDAKKPESFQNLQTTIEKETALRNLGELRIIYLSTPPEAFCDFTKQFVDACVIETKTKNHRVVYEKPFGWNCVSAKEIWDCITKYLDESQIYTIDHYLAKPIVHSFLSLREDNAILKSLWNFKNIESVQIIFNETIDIEGRGSFYDRYGVLKDVVQNHILQLLTLVIIKSSSHYTPEERARMKARVLTHLRFDDGVLGQYAGYRDEKGVDKHSRTPTFASLILWCDLPEWKGIPFYITAGKSLNKKQSDVIISFKNGPIGTNNLTVHIAPKEALSLSLYMNDLTGQKSELTLKSSDFPVSQNDAYEVLLQEIVKGIKSSVVSIKEILEAWRIIEAIEKKMLPLLEYKKMSEGVTKNFTNLICYM